MKKYLALLVVVVMLFSVVSCSSGDKDPGQPIELSLAHFFPGTHPAESVFIQGWIEEIKDATDGRVVITSYPGETLAKADAIYNGVLEGIADIGLSCFSYTRGRFPVLEGFELPGVVYKNSKVASKVAWEGIKELDADEVKDTKLMMVIATGPGDLFTKTPVEKLEDLSGLEIRATGISARTIELLGGIPVAMAQSEAYESLSRGVVKGNLSPVEVLKGWRHAEVTDYLTLTPFLYNTLFFVTMNLDKWNSLPDDVQEAILEVNEKYADEIGNGLWDMQNEEALKWAVDEEGIQIIELSEDETARWIEKVMPIQDDFTESVKDITDKNVMEIIHDLADKYNAEY